MQFSNQKKILLFIILCLLAGIFAWFFLSQKPTAHQHEQQKHQTSAPSPDISMKNFTLKEFEKSKKYGLIVNAQEGTFSHSSDLVTCNKISCTIFKQNDEIAHLQAPLAKVKRMLKEIMLVGPVCGTMKDVTINGEDVRYNFSSHIITTEKPMVYRHKLGSFVASKSEFNVKENAIEMSGGIRSEFFLDRSARNKP